VPRSMASQCTGKLWFMMVIDGYWWLMIAPKHFFSIKKLARSTQWVTFEKKSPSPEMLKNPCHDAIPMDPVVPSERKWDWGIIYYNLEG
jgi:hypothetical protein